MKRFDLITPEGTRDLLFEDCAAVRAVETRLQNSFKAKGYSEVITPGTGILRCFQHEVKIFSSGKYVQAGR